jgi:GntR family transcriptional regulator, uxu operon transcriptional repressor
MANDGLIIEEANQREIRSYQVVGQSLLDRIRTGEFHAIGKLPTERELAEIYGVGRAVIRDALVMLEVKGLVQSRQGSGIYITKAAYDDIDSQEIEGRDEGALLFSRPKAIEVVIVQQAFESRMARIAAAKAREEHLAGFESVLGHIEACNHSEELVRLCLRMHTAIVSCSRNTEYLAVQDFIRRRRELCEPPPPVDLGLSFGEFKKIALEDYALIAKNIEHQDGDGAYYAMWRHFQRQISLLTGNNRKNTWSSSDM